MGNFFQKFKDANKNMTPLSKLALIGAFIFLFLRLNLERVFQINTGVEIIILIFSLVLHELGHGFMAYFCGDQTAKIYGRLSLNPLKHLDPVGTLFPILMILIGSPMVIGWAKPVPVNYRGFKNGRVGEFLVAISGALMNFILVIIGAILFREFRFSSDLILLNGLEYLITINIILGIFNLLPIPPLDGSRVIGSFLNGRNREVIFDYDRFGILIVIFLGYFGILNKILGPIYITLINLINYYIAM
ncbi:MAG: site-2 protease family protein [Cetobacterium sp.]|nr:site-2 protease family protein [Cetobacterium sp.]